MRGSNPLRLLEAAYSFGQDETAWLAGIVAAVKPYDLGRGVVAYASEFSPGRNRVRSYASERLALEKGALDYLVDSLDPAFYRQIHAPFATSFADDVWPRAAKQLGLSYDEIVQKYAHISPMAAWAFSGGDATREGVIVVFHCHQREDLPARHRHELDCFAAHLSSALRLRSILRESPTGDHEGVDAVIAPDGRMLHAKTDASKEDRGSLIDAVRRSERARLRRATPEEQLDLWTALVEGRWSILEQVDRDGKRMLLACQNEPRTIHIRALSARERSIVEYAALGHSFKYIAYELGLPLPTVAAQLKLALRKLGLRSRAELVELFARNSPGVPGV